MGRRQWTVLARAGRSRAGMVTPGGYLDLRAIRRLERRQLLVRAVGLPNVWILTALGRERLEVL